ncbi:MAG: UDP-N-acetylglucosamine--N-acetylmuramyl-(pentapeptide) pyrophosphoryl-undecaprenol N-acetylglucosamine transferase [Puniceicoccales bacterium]|jgi:UDP-N-acetylglucosamine--N-acetylmuramyl-(pentapeptide) pyrophosphoryl-undecaprenol N-acetylglucosamine transferase|nr:UDP-N-acetylglucosamine--N-acetylmuramyl-(pentapeptide) pyrophosphoryl-undecaprenol N-acetylglucosamine transferase [Puniceicoccales bacterium]
MRIFIACGGTGGHLTPGIAVAQRFHHQGYDVLLGTSKKPIDVHFRKHCGDLKFITLPGSGFCWRPAAFFRFFYHFIRGFFFSWKLLGRENVSAVLSFGGFSGLGIGLAAFLRRKPLLLHESNLCLGKAVRFLTPMARKVFIPPLLKNQEPFRRRKKFHPMGFPLREEFIPMDREMARVKLGRSGGGKLLLVTGGSQGARVLVDWTLTNGYALAERSLDIICLTGPGGREGTFSLPDSGGKFHPMEYVPFSDRMHLLYGAADLVLCRAGAGTIAELVACGKPSILVPYPHSAGNHQMANGLAMERAGAACLLRQEEMDRGLLVAVDNLFCPGVLEDMEHRVKQLRSQFSEDATGQIVEEFLSTVNVR